MSIATEAPPPTAVPPRSAKGTPPWEIAMLFPEQGSWTESDYFALNTNRLVELSEGFLEVLPMPTLYHQDIVVFLHQRLQTFLDSWGSGGRAYFAPVPIRLWPEKIREPDVFVVPKEQLVNRLKTPERIDLAMEVVSEGSEGRDRDYEKKRADYAKAGIPEYWIIDPAHKKITVLVMDGNAYREHGAFGPGTKATSNLLPGFEISVDECWQAGSS